MDSSKPTVRGQSLQLGNQSPAVSINALCWSMFLVTADS